MSATSTWPRLSEELGFERLLHLCQSCGILGEIGDELDRWEEHDDRDKPEGIVVLLCRPCADRLIIPHPRLYLKLDAHEPMPGSMRMCVDCTHREGLACTHPDLLRNGGSGLAIETASSMRVHVTRSPRSRSGFVTWWDGPPKACAGRELVGPAWRES